MVISTHTRNKNNVLTIGRVGTGEVLEMPYCSVNSVEDVMVVDIDDSLRQ
jgi:spermidine synthase